MEAASTRKEFRTRIADVFPAVVIGFVFFRGFFRAIFYRRTLVEFRFDWAKGYAGQTNEAHIRFFFSICFFRLGKKYAKYIYSPQQI